MLARFHHVREHRTCGRELTRAAAVEHGRAEKIPLNHNAVVDTVYRIERILIAYKQREHADRDLISGKLRRTDQLNRSFELGCIAEVRAVNLRNALGVDILEIHLFARHERGEDGNLPAGVMTLDIRLRIPLRIAEALRIRKHIAELCALAVHARQDVIGRAVQNTGNLRNYLALISGSERANHRDAAADRSLEEEVDLLFARNPQKLRAVRRDQCLITRHDMLAL